MFENNESGTSSQIFKAITFSPKTFHFGQETSFPEDENVSKSATQSQKRHCKERTRKENGHARIRRAQTAMQLRERLSAGRPASHSIKKGEEDCQLDEERSRYSNDDVEGVEEKEKDVMRRSENVNDSISVSLFRSASTVYRQNNAHSGNGLGKIKPKASRTAPGYHMDESVDAKKSNRSSAISPGQARMHKSLQARFRATTQLPEAVDHGEDDEWTGVEGE